VLPISIDPYEVLDWIKRSNESFINARKVARKFKISTKAAGHVLRKLKDMGYLKIHSYRRGRFNIYKVKLKISRLRRKKEGNGASN